MVAYKHVIYLKGNQSVPRPYLVPGIKRNYKSWSKLLGIRFQENPVEAGCKATKINDQSKHLAVNIKDLQVLQLLSRLTQHVV